MMSYLSDVQDERMEVRNTPISISKTATIEAMHYLPNHKGKCSRPHGHSYKITIKVDGFVNTQHGSSSEGMVVDFSTLGDIIRQFDHQNLNEIFPPDFLPTTAENFVLYLLMLLDQRLSTQRNKMLSIEVKVSETESSEAKASIIY